MKKTIFLLTVILSVLFSACNNKSSNASRGNEQKESFEIPLKHAKEFKIEKSGDNTIVKIHKKGEDGVFDTFNLVKDKAKAKGIPNSIPVPCKRIVCLSSTQLSYFFALEDIDDIVAINSSRYLRHEGMKSLVEAGKVKRIGKEGNFNLEMLAALDPDVIFVSPFKVGGFDVLRNLGIPLVPMAAYNEETPLGRAEWIKMLALFVGQEDKADSIFNGIESRYQNLKKISLEC
jgi:ABC-type Fe3+-hydroxamate transport system, periplasmic component